MIPKQTILDTIQAAPIQSGAKRIITEDVEALADSPVHVVTGCGGCPMLGSVHVNNQLALLHCNHPKADNSFECQSYAGLMLFCPLKQHSLTIQLAQ